MADGQEDAQALGFDPTALRQKYRQERDKRLREEGNEQYIEVKGDFAHFLDDPYAEPGFTRDPLFDEVEVVLVGGGFGGLLAGARLRQAGIEDIRIIDPASDFGGTWYWNRYPGAQCDTASMIYMPLLEETGHMPSEKYAHAPEILEQCQRIGRQYGLYDNALFHTEVEDLSWEEAQSRWMIRTNRGDAFTASFIGLGTGPLHVPKLPGIPGIEDFKGHAFHTSRWDYDYTGGDPRGGLMEKLADKRVAIIGTGATSVQAVPHLARACQTLYVVQRTPSSVDVRANAPIDPEWFKSVAEPGWQQRWLENFTANQGGNITEVDLVMDGWTDLSRRIRSRINELPPEDRTPFKMLAAFEDSDFEKMEEIRARVDSIVADTETAQKLKAWYRQLCKRPCFHDAYLQAFNTPGTHLVDTDGKGVEAITEKGFVVAGVEYEVDCIIYASGFEVGTPFEQRAGFDLTGRGGLKLSEAWAEGMKSLHGIHVRDFPNAFFVQPTQGANLISNIPHNLTESGRTIAMTIRHALDVGAKEVEVTPEAQAAWVDLLLTGMGRMLGAPDCTPGYYNNEGQDPGPAAQLNVGYPQGASAFFKYIDGWRASGAFEGLTFR
ncbi:NAD(P)/FAD-dependent oxidoreductase [Phenylobacterium sp.]|uniref:flavin-containing monooxygenase n=1 Tax=Phenylobacterium sp. TaxID=1871053 RepID=UPI00263124B1|nr:NAD(P)/FAD-dependent oxidoreductase [Phenylobacterium sp.]